MNPLLNLVLELNKPTIVNEQLLLRQELCFEKQKNSLFAIDFFLAAEAQVQFRGLHDTAILPFFRWQALIAILHLGLFENALTIVFDLNVVAWLDRHWVSWLFVVDFMVVSEHLFYTWLPQFILFIHDDFGYNHAFFFRVEWSNEVIELIVANADLFLKLMISFHVHASFAFVEKLLNNSEYRIVKAKTLGEFSLVEKVGNARGHAKLDLVHK